MIHNSITYRGFTAVTYGESSMSIINGNGKTVVHTGSFSGDGSDRSLRTAIDSYCQIPPDVFERIYNDKDDEDDDF